MKSFPVGHRTAGAKKREWQRPLRPVSLVASLRTATSEIIKARPFCMSKNIFVHV
jgi:hypothetical protein